jgi:hypothetical protein
MRSANGIRREKIPTLLHDGRQVALVSVKLEVVFPVMDIGRDIDLDP